MKLKVWLKTNAADKALSPLRQQLIEIIEPGSSLLDIGCGSGDLLFKAANKIDHGLGVDLDKDMIDFAKNKCDINTISNLIFYNEDVLTLNLEKFDVATSTLCLHEMPTMHASSILKQMAMIAQRIIIADYATPKSLTSKIAIEIDEMISGHYKKFRHYRKLGGLPYLAVTSELRIRKCIASEIDGILIWELEQ